MCELNIELSKGLWQKALNKMNSIYDSMKD